MAETPAVAPYESCIRCYRGDTTTAIGFRGDAERFIGGLVFKLGLPREEAVANGRARVRARVRLRARRAARRRTRTDRAALPRARPPASKR